MPNNGIEEIIDKIAALSQLKGEVRLKGYVEATTFGKIVDAYIADLHIIIRDRTYYAE